jgi:hypothetical protein
MFHRCPLMHLCCVMHWPATIKGVNTSTYFLTESLFSAMCFHYLPLRLVRLNWSQKHWKYNHHWWCLYGLANLTPSLVGPIPDYSGSSVFKRVKMTFKLSTQSPRLWITFCAMYEFYTQSCIVKYSIINWHIIRVHII